MFGCWYTALATVFNEYKALYSLTSSVGRLSLYVVSFQFVLSIVHTSFALHLFLSFTPLLLCVLRAHTARHQKQNRMNLRFCRCIYWHCNLIIWRTHANIHIYEWTRKWTKNRGKTTTTNENTSSHTYLKSASQSFEWLNKIYMRAFVLDLLFSYSLGISRSNKILRWIEQEWERWKERRRKVKNVRIEHICNDVCNVIVLQLLYDVFLFVRHSFVDWADSVSVLYLFTYLFSSFNVYAQQHTGILVEAARERERARAAAAQKRVRKLL